jgi:hypothetical protein
LLPLSPEFGDLGGETLGGPLLLGPDLGNLGGKGLPHLRHLGLKPLGSSLLFGSDLLKLFLLKLKVADQPLLLFGGHGKGLKMSFQF